MKTIRIVLIVFLFTLLIFYANGQSGPYNSFESYNYPGKFIRHAFGLGELSDFTGHITSLDKEDATFKLVPGLADNRYKSFESLNYPGFYLRHQNGRIKLNDSASDNSQLFKKDATFKIVPGLADSSDVSFESFNYPGNYLRHRDGHLWVEHNDNSQLFKGDATFKIVAPKYTVTTQNASGSSAISTQPGKIQVPPLILPRVQLPLLISKNETGSSSNKIVNRIVDPSLLDWKANQRLAMYNILSNGQRNIVQSANLDFADENSQFIDSGSNDLTARFNWAPTITNPSLAPASEVWQVSILSFPCDPKNWANPPGLIAQGTLRSDERTFSVDFSQFNPTNKEVAQHWMMSKPNLLFQKKVLTTFRDAVAANLAMTNPANTHTVQAKKDLLLTVNNAISRIEIRPIISLHVMAANNSVPKANNIASTVKSSVPLIKINTNNLQLINSSAKITGTLGKGASHDMAKSRFPLSKESLAYALPQERRTYYIRIVPLDAKGNCTGLPSEEKEVTVGTPIIEAVAAMNTAHIGWIQKSSDDIKLAVASDYAKPIKSNEFCNGKYQESDKFMDWSHQDLSRWFAWRSNLTNLKDAEWQVSVVPFNNIELSNPTGLVDRGKLNLDSADLEQDICGGTIAGYPASQSNQIPSFWPRFAIHEFSIDFSKFAPAPDQNNPQKINYYVRVVALAPVGPGKFIGYSSPTRTITYGQPDNTPIPTSEVVSVPVAVPDVKMLSYKPEQGNLEGWDYLFKATADMPPYDEGCFNQGSPNQSALFQMPGIPLCIKQGSLWHKGQIVDTRAKSEDKSWLDEVVDFFKSIVDFFADIINWVSQAWDDIKGACASVISEGICFGDDTCSEKINGFVSSTIDTGLMSMGIPTHIPNFNELTNIGAEYLTKTLGPQARIQSKSADYAKDMTSDVVKPGVQKFVDESGSGGSNGLVPIPELQGHPAYMLIEIRNSQSEPTLPGTLTISDEPNHLFSIKPLPIPPLQSGENFTVPVVFNRVPTPPLHASGNGGFVEYCPDPKTDRDSKNNWEICSYDWNELSGEQETFKARFSYDPELLQSMVDPIKADEESKGKKQANECIIGDAGTYCIEYLTKGVYYDEATITPNQPWSSSPFAAVIGAV